MAIVVRLGPLPLGRRRPERMAELERIFGRVVELTEVVETTALASAVEMSDVVAVALDASEPGALADAVALAGSLPVLRPLWSYRRNSRGEIDELFDGYGLLTPEGVVRLADGQLSTP